jgi:hypothetical protein
MCVHGMVDIGIYACIIYVVLTTLHTGHTSTSSSQHQHAHQQQEQSQEPHAGGHGLRGSVTICDINPEMLAEGKKKAAAAKDLAGVFVI